MTTWTKLSAALAVAALVAASAHRAEAGPREDAARAAFEEARRAYNVGRWEEAIAGFERAYQLTGDPVLLFNLAQAYRQAGKTAQAITTYKAYIREAGSAPNRAIAEAKLRELEAGARTAPPVANPRPVTPAPESAPPPPPPRVAPPPAAPAPIAAVELATPAPPPAPSRSWRWVPWVGVVATAALAGGATLSGLAVQSRFDELAKNCGDTESGCPDGDIQALQARARWTNVLFGLAGAAAIGTGVAFYVGSGEASASVAVKF